MAMPSTKAAKKNYNLNITTTNRQAHNNKMSTNKKKPIAKPPKSNPSVPSSSPTAKKQAKSSKRRRDNGAGYGRPSKSDAIENIKDPTHPILECITEYLFDIKMHHMLFFKDSLRAQMNKHAAEGFPTWNQTDTWLHQEELFKIQSSSTIQQLFERVSESKGISADLLTNAYLIISRSVSCRQCTSQIYGLLSYALERSLEPPSLQKLDVSSLALSFQFLIPRFTKITNDYWLMFEKDKQKIDKYFQEMVDKLRARFRIFLHQHQQIQQFINEMQQDDADLDFIKQANSLSSHDGITTKTRL